MGHHPFFASPLHWHTDYADAQHAAAAQNTLLLVVHGHRLCGGTRALIERSLRKEELVEFVAGRFALLASDSDAPAPWLAPLVAALPKREPTPLCIYVRSDGKVVTSTVGGRPPAVLLNDLMQAQANASR